MIDVFTEEVEVMIKDGIANLYWYRNDLKKALLRSGVDTALTSELMEQKDPNGNNLSKRRIMDSLYEKLRLLDYDRRLEISRNFVRILIEHNNFVQQDEKHKVLAAERAALKLKDIIRTQQEDKEYRENIRRRANEAKKEDYYSQLLELRDKFNEARGLAPQKRGYELEKLFRDLMQISGIPVEEPFRIEGEQDDGGIKYDGHYYIVELKWTQDKIQPADVGSFYYKVDGKMDARGIFIAMNGFTDAVTTTLIKGKDMKVLLLDGTHFANVIFGIYTFQELLEHAIRQATLKGITYCGHSLSL